MNSLGSHDNMLGLANYDPNRMQSREYYIQEWVHFINTCDIKADEHSDSSVFWNIIYHSLSISSIIISAIITADGAGDFMNKQAIFWLGVVLTTISSISALINAGNQWEDHKWATERYKSLLNQARRCDSFKWFLEMQNDFSKLSKDAPNILMPFRKLTSSMPIMNPHLLYELEVYYNHYHKEDKPDTTDTSDTTDTADTTDEPQLVSDTDLPPNVSSTNVSPTEISVDASTDESTILRVEPLRKRNVTPLSPTDITSLPKKA